uniref:Uncharacterized protein n=1 Tax=Populus alba TaxID=43335 RepID=A0A4V6A5G2_POPAL|nr:hypothetical protein D5086_0000232990 [Populus alba]
MESFGAVAAAGTGEGRKRKIVVLIGYCRRGVKRRSFRWRGISVVERVEDELVAALVKSLAAEVTTVQEDEVCRGERHAGRRRKRGSRWLLGGRLDSYGGAGVRGDV